MIWVTKNTKVIVSCLKQVWFWEQKGTIYVSKLFVEIFLNFPITSWLKLNRGQQFLQFDWPTRKKSRKLKERAQGQIIPFFWNNYDWWWWQTLFGDHIYLLEDVLGTTSFFHLVFGAILIARTNNNVMASRSHIWPYITTMGSNEDVVFCHGGIFRS